MELLTCKFLMVENRQLSRKVLQFFSWDKRPVATFIAAKIIALSVANCLCHGGPDFIFRFMERRCENVYPNNDDPNFKIQLEFLIRNKKRLCLLLAEDAFMQY